MCGFLETVFHHIYHFLLFIPIRFLKLWQGKNILAPVISTGHHMSHSSQYHKNIAMEHHQNGIVKPREYWVWNQKTYSEKVTQRHILTYL